MDVIHSILKFVDHERYKIIGIVGGILIVFVMVGCDVEAVSPFTGQPVTRPQFAVELSKESEALSTQKAEIEALTASYNRQIESLNAKAVLAEEEFQKKELLREKFIEVTAGLAVTAASGGTITGAQIIAALLTVGGIGGTVGGVVDASRKNKIIAEAKTTIT